MSDTLYFRAKEAAVEFLRCAGTDAREKFLEEISRAKRTELPDLFDKVNVNYQYAVDWTYEANACGWKFVYAWVDGNGEIFYIGCGWHTRVYETTNRTQKFKDKISTGGCKAHGQALAAVLYRPHAAYDRRLCPASCPNTLDVT